MTTGAFLARLIAMLDAAGIPHMIAGSFASTYHGTPRATQDIDLVIDPEPPPLAVFVARMAAEGYYLDERTAREALRRRSQFNVIDAGSGWKADLIIRKDREFSREEFRRRVPARMLDVDVFVASAEDTILAKLEWAARSGSERQLADASGILRVKGADLDQAYIRRWAQELGLTELWRRLSGS